MILAIFYRKKLHKVTPYYSESEFSKLLNNKGGLSILSVNIQCASAKFDGFQAFIDRIIVIKPINVICLQECWLKNYDNVTMFNHTGYDMVYQAGRCCAHGGLIIYIQNGLECIAVTELNISSTGWEYLCVEINIQYAMCTELPAILLKI